MSESRFLPSTRAIDSYRFYGLGATGLITGFYVDRDGTNLGSLSTTVPYISGTAVDLSGGTDGKGLPAAAVGAIVRSSGTVVFAPGSAAGDLVAHPDRYPVLSTSFASIGQAKFESAGGSISTSGAPPLPCYQFAIDASYGLGTGGSVAVVGQILDINEQFLSDFSMTLFYAGTSDANYAASTVALSAATFSNSVAGFAFSQAVSFTIQDDMTGFVKISTGALTTVRCTAATLTIANTYPIGRIA